MTSVSGGAGYCMVQYNTKTDFLCYDPIHNFMNSQYPSKALSSTSLLPLVQHSLWESPTS